MAIFVKKIIKLKKGLCKMRKKSSFFVIILVIVMCVVCLTACGETKTDDNSQVDNTTKEYTIQYTDDTGTHQITVTKDMPYSITSIPQKTGYVFMGLFDAEIGGTQYVSASGASLALFTDARNLVLFPQFKAKSYTVILDYQGAKVTGTRQLTATYDSSIPELPKNLEYDHKSFVGWYTKPNKEGVLMADNEGLIPVVSVINEKNFDLNSEFIYLYAGFEEQKYEVTCCFEDGMETESVTVEYGTAVSKIVTETRVNGKAPVAWSKTKGGEAFNGKITGETVLYAIEYAPVLDFDSDGGSEVKSIVSRSGSKITLPVPTKDMAKFVYWQDKDGNTFDSAVMPEESLTLKAVWQAIIKFDTNGGTAVEDISVATGNKVELPTTEKDGYMFAGWYIGDQKYTSTAMPAQSVELKARYYKIEKIIKNIVTATIDGYVYAGSTPNNSYAENVELNDIPTDSIESIKIKGAVLLKARNATMSTPAKIVIDFYKDGIISDSYLLSRHTFDVTSSGDYQRFEFSAEWKDITSKARVLYYNGSGSSYVSDFYIEIEYPDTSKLY